MCGESPVGRFHNFAAETGTGLLRGTGHEGSVTQAGSYRSVQVDQRGRPCLPESLTHRGNDFGQKRRAADTPVGAARVTHETVVADKHRPSETIVEQDKEDIISIDVQFAGNRDRTEETVPAPPHRFTGGGPSVEDHSFFAGKPVSVSDELQRTPFRITPIKQIAIVAQRVTKRLAE